MDNRCPELETLLDLENRHEELLQRLDELDKQVEKVLAEWSTQREMPATVA